MGTLIFSFLTGNKSRPQFKCNLTYIPGFFSGIIFFIPNRNIHHPRILLVIAVAEGAGMAGRPTWVWRTHAPQSRSSASSPPQCIHTGPSSRGHPPSQTGAPRARGSGRWCPTWGIPAPSRPLPLLPALRGRGAARLAQGRLRGRVLRTSCGGVISTLGGGSHTVQG